MVNHLVHHSHQLQNRVEIIITHLLQLILVEVKLMIICHHILLYICDTANNQQAMRARLFLRWFNKFADSKEFVIKTAEVQSDEAIDYIALIIQKSHPSFDAIIALFDSEITMFKTNKNPEDTLSTDSHIDA